jgi:hypothetical protein
MRAAARRARAGKLVWGRVWVSRDSIKVRAGVIDAIDGTTLREKEISGPRDLLDKQPGVLRLLAAELIRLDGVPLGASSGEIGTRNLAAWRAYQEGQRALTTWRVLPAIEHFERAVAADADYAYAQAWLAQLQLWRDQPVAVWGPHVSTALRNRASLGARETSMVEALQAIQRGAYSDACRAYDDMRARDSLDAAAWLGLAHCQGLDPVVVRSSASKSGYVFRGSMAGAQRAYARAMQIAPSSFCAFHFESVVRLFVVESNRFRVGANADSQPYFGLQDVIGDSIAYVARPFTDLRGTPFEVLAPAYDRALQRNRDALLTVLSTLAQRSPDNPDVFESLARVLETRDEITGTPNGGYSALSALERAKLLSKDSVQRARLGAADVRLHLKLGDFSRTAAIGDSILAAKTAPSPAVARYLAGVAALLGREQLAITFLRSSGTSVMDAGAPAVPLIEDVSTALFVRAALGACDDSLKTLHKRVGTLLESYVNPAQRDVARTGMLMRPTMFAVGCLGAASAVPLTARPAPMMQAIQALGRGEVARSRSMLDSMQRIRRVVRPGDLSLDYLMAEVWLSTALGDTTAAIHQLDLTLTALPALSYYVVYETGMAAAVGRSMAFRADIAARRGDAGTAALWASRVLTLWAHSDPSLAPTIARMKALAAHSS